jgi:hypothetical protein
MMQNPLKKKKKVLDPKKGLTFGFDNVCLPELSFTALSYKCAKFEVCS